MNLSNQNSEKSLQLLAAKDTLYTSASTWSYFVYVSALAPLALQLLKLRLPQLAEWETFVNLIGLVAVVSIDYLVKSRIQTATRIYEEFDTDLFGLPWHETVSDSKISPEERRRAAGDTQQLGRYKNWYTPESLDNIENSLAVLLCQRQNTFWDLKQKQRFAQFLGWVLALTATILLGWGWFQNGLTFREWITWGLLPVAGFLVKTTTLYRDFMDVAQKQASLASDITAAWDENKATQSPVSPNRLRHFQDRIFDYRKRNTLVPGWLYNWFKTNDQKIATESTIELINSIQKRPSN